MKSFFVTCVAVTALAVTTSFADDFEDAVAAVDSAEAANTPGMADENHFEYFDCWIERASFVIPKERDRIGAIRDETQICGCYTVREKGGYGWRGEDEPKKILRVWDVPKPRLLTCPKGSSCSQEMFVAQCMDHIRESGPVLTDFAKGGAMEGAIALMFEDGSATPFGEYINAHAGKTDSIGCFFNIHDRPDVAEQNDRRNPSLFRLKGLPKKLVPSAIARFTDFSDLRCLDKGVLTGFAGNGYVENIRHVDANGLIHGEETGYMNDPLYPKKQGPEWGKVFWTAKYKRGKRDGVAKFYRSSVYDRSDKEYYFRHLEVPYTQGFVNGTVRMYSDSNFLMAEIPMKRNAMHGRMTVFNPFKKKNLTLTFNANDLEGFVDFGDFGGVYHKGLPNGLITFWTVKDSCYQWMPGDTVCYTQRLTKKQWGSYKMGVFQGKMECANGEKGDKNLICPDLDSAMVAKMASDAAAALQTKEQASMDSSAVAKPVEEKVAIPEAAEPTKVDAKKARLEAEKARREAKAAEKAALKAEREAKKAEKARLAKEKKAEKARIAREKKAERARLAKEKREKAKAKKAAKKNAASQSNSASQSSAAPQSSEEAP